MQKQFFPSSHHKGVSSFVFPEDHFQPEVPEYLEGWYRFDSMAVDPQGCQLFRWVAVRDDITPSYRVTDRDGDEVNMELTYGHAQAARIYAAMRSYKAAAINRYCKPALPPVVEFAQRVGVFRGEMVAA